MSLKPETLFRQKVVRDLLTLEGIAVFSIQQRTIKGDPDLMMCVKGQFVGLELKSLNGKATKLQEFKLEKIRNAGGVGVVAFPDNWDSVFKQIKLLAEGKI